MIRIVDANDAFAIQQVETEISGITAVGFNQVYKAIKQCIDWLYDAAVDIAQQFVGEVIIYLPFSRLATKLSNSNGDIIDFRLPDQTFRAAKITFHAKIVYFIFTVDMPYFDLSKLFSWIHNIALPNTDNLNYYADDGGGNVYQKGYDFTPSRFLMLADLGVEAIILGVLVAITASLVKLGYGKLAAKTFAKAAVSGSMPKTDSENISDLIEAVDDVDTDMSANFLDTLTKIATLTSQATTIAANVEDLLDLDPTADLANLTDLVNQILTRIRGKLYF